MNWPVKRLVRIAVLSTVPWLPTVAFEKATFYLHVEKSGLYGTFSGARFPVDIFFFALGGLIVASLLRPRFAILQTFLSTMAVWFFFYQFCPTFITSRGLLDSGCYQVGPDGLAGYRMGLFLFSIGALPTFVIRQNSLRTLVGWPRLAGALIGGLVVATATVWYPMIAWFSGVLLLPFLAPLQALMLFGVPGLAVGVSSAKISRSLRVSLVSGLTSFMFLAASFWTLHCALCDRSLVFLMAPSWAAFSLLGGLLELGVPTQQFPRVSAIIGVQRRFLGYSSLALVIVLSVSSAVLDMYWDPNVLYTPGVSYSASKEPAYYGVPAYRPYVAGYYDSTQYRICCLEVGVNFTSVDLSKIRPGNYLMAGMGVQSPNCCVDGWDLGWRADVFLMPGGTMLVSASSWGTCDGNAGCGGHFWQHHRYQVVKTITPQAASTPIYLRMMWEEGRVNWYYNFTGVPWEKYGSFKPDFREGKYFDIGVVYGGPGNYPYQAAFFFQFGVSSRTLVSGWTVSLLNPSFMYEGAWRIMEHARIIQGDHSYWKANYRWGGAPYNGVTAKANALDPTVEKYRLELSYSGKTSRDHTLLW